MRNDALVKQFQEELERFMTDPIWRDKILQFIEFCAKNPIRGQLLKLVDGTMRSEKTSEFLSDVRQVIEAEMHYFIFKPEGDTRLAGHLVCQAESHNSIGTGNHSKMNGKSDLDPSLCYPAVTIPDNNPVQILFYVAAKMIELELKTPEERR